MMDLLHIGLVSSDNSENWLTIEVPPEVIRILRDHEIRNVKFRVEEKIPSIIIPGNGPIQKKKI